MSIEMRELGIVSVASPCKAKWEQMQGDDQVRHCHRCNKNVYHLSAMTSLDARELLLRKEGRLCVRFYTRADGTMLTRDCPTGVRRKRLRALAALASAATVLLSGIAFVLDAGGLSAASQKVRAVFGEPAACAIRSGEKRGLTMGGMRRFENNQY